MVKYSSRRPRRTRPERVIAAASISSFRVARRRRRKTSPMRFSTIRPWTPVEPSATRVVQDDANLRALLDSTSDLIWSVDLNHRLLSFNQALCHSIRSAFGVQPAAGMAPADLLPPAQAAQWPALYDRALAEGPLPHGVCPGGWPEPGTGFPPHRPRGASHGDFGLRPGHQRTHGGGEGAKPGRGSLPGEVRQGVSVQPGHHGPDGFAERATPGGQRRVHGAHRLRARRGDRTQHAGTGAVGGPVRVRGELAAIPRDRPAAQFRTPLPHQERRHPHGRDLGGERGTGRPAVRDLDHHRYYRPGERGNAPARPNRALSGNPREHRRGIFPHRAGRPLRGRKPRVAAHARLHPQAGGHRAALLRGPGRGGMPPRRRRWYRASWPARRRKAAS